ncbi:MAG: hypothetical protein HY000_04170 [Planctomycetes bacterium]|nr:hypothetical protein [Planctomycetota bacterium]
MRRYILSSLAAALTAIPLAVNAQEPCACDSCCQEEGWLRRAGRSVATDYRRNSTWPKPFLPAERESVCAPFALMVDKGWQAQNTLGNYHFSEGTANLTEAGKLRVRSIMNDVPPAYRTVYVPVGETEDLTTARLETVERFVERSSHDEGVTNVASTTRPPRGRSADVVDAVTRSFFQSTPVPRIPAATTASSSGQ